MLRVNIEDDIKNPGTPRIIIYDHDQNYLLNKMIADLQGLKLKATSDVRENIDGNVLVIAVDSTT